MPIFSYPALGFDPAPGQPEQLERTAHTCTQLGRDFASDAALLRRIGQAAIWKGEAATTFDERASTLARDLDAAATAYGGVGRTLDHYAGVLRGAQAHARAAEQEAADALRRASRLRAAVDEADRQLRLAANGADLTGLQGEHRLLARRLGDAHTDYQAAIARAHRLHQQVRGAAATAARSIRALAQTRPYEQPGLLERAGSLIAQTTALAAASIDRWVDEHAELLRSISNILKIVAAVTTVLAFVPALTPIMGPIALATGSAALAIDSLLVLTGNGDWKTLIVDAALTVIPGGRILATVTKGARAAFRAATRLRRAAKLAEKAWSPRLQAIVERHGGQLVGFKHRLKTHKSLRRKIHNDMRRNRVTADQAADRLNDVLRYTMEYPVETLAARTQASTRELAAQGLQEVQSVKNFWVEGNRYKGLNGQFRTADGQPVEVQFHTTESYQMKDLTHPSYEVFRDQGRSLEERQAAYDEMVRLSAQLEHPPGVERIGELVRTRRPS